MKQYNWHRYRLISLSVALIIGMWSHNLYAQQEVTKIKVEAGNIESWAIGEDSRSNVTIGGIQSDNNGTSISSQCAEISVKVGNIRRLALGKHSVAEVVLPDDTSNKCDGGK